MKKILIAISIFLVSWCVYIYASGNQWCCSWHKWVDYCAANGRIMCKDWTYSPSCTCKSNTRNTSNSYTNSYNYPTYSNSAYGATTVNMNQKCKNTYWYNSYYDGWQCKCSYWYVMYYQNYKQQCISYNQYCKNLYWTNTTSNWLWQCECIYGYMYDSEENKCVSKKTYYDNTCKRKYWMYAQVVSDNYNKCRCKNWYKPNKNKTYCVIK